MKYMLLVYLDENALDDVERADCYTESAALTRELDREGRFIAASPLHPTSTATSVRVREGRRIVSDGPFAETREQLGGFFLVDADNLDAAIEIASRVPIARRGTIEVRPVIDIPGLPGDEASELPVTAGRRGETPDA